MRTRLLRDSGMGSPPDRNGGAGFSVTQACVCTVVPRGIPWGSPKVCWEVGTWIHGQGPGEVMGSQTTLWPQTPIGVYEASQASLLKLVSIDALVSAVSKGFSCGKLVCEEE